MRETAREIAIEAETVTPIYQDQKQIVRKLGAHLTEMFMGEVLGAGGVGGTLLNVPFEPAYVRVINADGATPAVTDAAFSTNPAHVTTILAVALQATPVAKAKVAEGDWTITLPTALAPDAETVVVIVHGFRDVGGSL
jgi:hypothetical protein